MRRWFAYIVLLMASFTTMHAVALTSNDPYWIGNDATYGTTEDTDFWLTFMRNGGNFSPETSPNIIFELKIAVSARQATTVHFAIGNTDVHTHALQARNESVQHHCVTSNNTQSDQSLNMDMCR